MKVKDLIKKLQNLDQMMPVVCSAQPNSPSADAVCIAAKIRVITVESTLSLLSEGEIVDVMDKDYYVKKEDRLKVVIISPY